MVCSALLLHAGPITYSLIDLGVLEGGNITTGRAISSNGWVAGYGDIDSGATQAFSWKSSFSVIGPSDSPAAYGLGINSSGYFVGYAYTADFGQYNAFLYGASGFTAIPTLGGTNNAAYGINNAGVVVGWSEDSTGLQTAFQYSGGTSSALSGLPAATSSRATAINSSGLIVGATGDTESSSTAFLYDPASSVLTLLGAPSSHPASEALAISDSGLVAGYASSDADRQAFLYDGSFHLLGTLGGDSIAYGVNSDGTVVGTSDDTAFVYYKTSGMFDLNTLLVTSGWTLSDAMAVNDLGQIVGTGYYGADGQQHAYLLTPSDSPGPPSSVPEPGTWALLAGGLAGLAFLRRRFHS